jgi:type IV pilus assembly protein PilZ
MAEGGNALSFDWGGNSNEVSRETDVIKAHQTKPEVLASLTKRLDEGKASSQDSTQPQSQNEKVGIGMDELSSLLEEIETVSSNTKPSIAAQVGHQDKVAFGSVSKESKLQPIQNQNLPLVLKIKDQKTLHAIWMPIFKYGGLFLPTDQLSGRTFEMNASAIFKITLFDQPFESIVLGVKTAWLTPQRNEHRLPSGVGFAFDTTDVAMSLHQRVSKILANVAQPSMTV